MQVVTPDDFAEYTVYHNNKLFSEQFAPRPCAYTVRRSVEHSAQGMVAIECLPDASLAISQPIQTFVSRSNATRAMNVPISASTEISLGGDRFVHGVECALRGLLMSFCISLRIPLPQVFESATTKLEIRCKGQAILFFHCVAWPHHRYTLRFWCIIQLMHRP